MAKGYSKFYPSRRLKRFTSVVKFEVEPYYWAFLFRCCPPRPHQAKVHPNQRRLRAGRQRRRVSAVHLEVARRRRTWIYRFKPELWIGCFLFSVEILL